MPGLPGQVAGNNNYGVQVETVVTRIQRHCRGWQWRGALARQKQAAGRIQAHSRGRFWRRELELQRKASIRIQAQVRGRICRGGGKGSTADIRGRLWQRAPPACAIPGDSVLADAGFTGHESPIDCIAKVRVASNYPIHKLCIANVRVGVAPGSPGLQLCEPH